MSNTILLCGGPGNGRWVVVQDPNKDYEILSQGRINWKPSVADTVIPQPVRTKYRIFREEIFGHGLWVGIPVDEPDHRRVIMQAVLQRDVAQYLGAFR